MNAAARSAAWVAVSLLAGLVAWRIVATTTADRLAADQPLQALQWDARQADALLALAQQQLARKEASAADQTLRQLLQHEPLSGNAWVLLGQAAEMQGDRARASQLFSIARQRAPHAQRPLAWLIGEQLEQGRHAEALENVDRLLRIAPGQHGFLLPLLVQMAEQPAFADALIAKLASRPNWRPQLISTLINKGSSATADRVLSGVQRDRGLDPAEVGRWIDRLARTGQWGEAYARWAGELDATAQGRLASVYNGNFESPPSGNGFDWRIGNVPGVIIEREALAGTRGSHALKLLFLERRVQAIPVNQWLLLSPGPYRLRFRARAHDLRADRGVQWLLRCQQPRGAELAASEILEGTFDWSELVVPFVVPDSHCVAQDLSLRNAGAEGPGKILFGSLWFDDVTIERVD